VPITELPPDVSHKVCLKCGLVYPKHRLLKYRYLPPGLHREVTRYVCRECFARMPAAERRQVVVPAGRRKSSRAAVVNPAAVAGQARLREVKGGEPAGDPGGPPRGPERRSPAVERGVYYRACPDAARGGQTVDNPYRVVEKNAAETVATVEGEPGDALRFATITLANLQAFVVKLAEIATPETEIDLYLDWLTIIGRPVSGDGKKMVFVAGMIVEETPDDPDGNPAAERGTTK
jgi:hypothetical protein